MTKIEDLDALSDSEFIDLALSGENRDLSLSAKQRELMRDARNDWIAKSDEDVRNAFPPNETYTDWALYSELRENGVGFKRVEIKLHNIDDLELIYDKASLEGALTRITGIPIDANLGNTTLLNAACNEIVLAQKDLAVVDIARVRQALIDLKKEGQFNFSDSHLVEMAEQAFHHDDEPSEAESYQPRI